MDTYKNLLNYSYALLARREYTKHNLIQKLRGRYPEASQADTNLVIEELEARNYISDERFADIFIRTKTESGWGKNKIKFALSKKGIEKEIIDMKLADLTVDLSLVQELIERKYKKELEILRNSEQNENKHKIKQKILRFLLSRGFSFSDFKDIEF